MFFKDTNMGKNKSEPFTMLQMQQRPKTIKESKLPKPKLLKKTYFFDFFKKFKLSTKKNCLSLI